MTKLKNETEIKKKRCLRGWWIHWRRVKYERPNITSLEIGETIDFEIIEKNSGEPFKDKLMPALPR